jgi:hypothetical protein
MRVSFPQRTLVPPEFFFAIHLFGGLLLQPFPATVGARIRSLVQRVRLWFSTSGEDGLTGIDTLPRDIRYGGDLRRCAALRRARELVEIGQLRRARKALDEADFGMVEDADAAPATLQRLPPPHAFRSSFRRFLCPYF